MKKIYLVILLAFLPLILVSCGNKQTYKNEYNQGEQVILDGVVYTYYTLENLYKEYIPFVDEEEYRPYYNAYYYDMSDFDGQKPIDKNFIGPTEYLGTFYPDTFYYYLSYSDPIHSPTDAYFFRLQDMIYFQDRYPYWKVSHPQLDGGFVVTSYTKNLKEEVIINSTIGEIPVLHIGYKAFENAPMKSFEFMSSFFSIENETFIHPFAFSSCENLESITTNACVLSMGICNCPNLKLIKNIRLSSDCSLYNLKNLNYILNLDARPLRPIGYDGYANLGFYQSFGIRKSSIYLCPKLFEISGREIEWRDSVTYFKNRPYYFDNHDMDKLKRVIVLKDEYFSNLRYNNMACVTYNPETMEMYLPLLNNGLQNGYVIEIDPSSMLIEEREDGYYIKVSFPKIVRGLSFYSDEYLEPVELKIISK